MLVNLNRTDKYLPACITGQLEDYFVKWVDQEKGISLQEAWDRLWNDKWNKDFRTREIKHTEKTIDFIGNKCNNTGWDHRILGTGNKPMNDKKDYEAIYYTLLHDHQKKNILGINNKTKKREFTEADDKKPRQRKWKNKDYCQCSRRRTRAGG
eukprot:11381123-Ditylum_brightwellii.AAC.1